jgi:hypothetical protein
LPLSSIRPHLFESSLLLKKNKSFRKIAMYPYPPLFVKGIGSRDAIPLLLSGMIGGATGGQLSQLMEIPTYLWWMSELMKFLLTILSLYIISIYWKQRKSKKNNN